MPIERPFFLKKSYIGVTIVSNVQNKIEFILLPKIENLVFFKKLNLFFFGTFFDNSSIVNNKKFNSIKIKNRKIKVICQ